MLRRVARALRLSCAFVGVLLLVSIPLSQFCRLDFTSPRPRGGLALLVEQGFVQILLVGEGYADLDLLLRVSRVEDQEYPWRVTLLPKFTHEPPVMLFGLRLPLWLLAFLCLAWPVISFVVARRRRRVRGFEVQAKDGGAVSTADS